jgi:proline racemase
VQRSTVPLRLGRSIRAVDLHACGEPGRVIVSGVDAVPGATMFEAMTWLRANRDDLRLRMLREPRGYPAANCNLVLPSSDPEADAGYVIMEQVEYPGMSGTNTMCVVTALLETGLLPMTEPVTELTLEAPAGLIRVRADCVAGKVTAVTFRNVPAFATHLAARIEVPRLGTVVVDVAYGGMFYVIAEAEPFGLRLSPDEGADIVRITEIIKAAANEQLPVVHPEQRISQSAPAVRMATRSSSAAACHGIIPASATSDTLHHQDSASGRWRVVVVASRRDDCPRSELIPRRERLNQCPVPVHQELHLTDLVPEDRHRHLRRDTRTA